ncbi:MAG: ABC transporter permease DevC [Bryobacteraceae bacterium]
MTPGLHLAWLQLTKRKGHFFAAIAGVSFAVTLMLGQIGLRDSLLETSTRLYSRFRADIVMTSWQYQFQQGSGALPERRIVQVLGVPGVLSCAPVRIGWAGLKNPVDHQIRQIVLLGIQPGETVLDFDGQTTGFEALREPDTFLFDSDSRAMFGPLADQARRSGTIPIEVSQRQGRIVGLFELGPGFATDGHLITSDLTYRRVTAGIATPLPALGLIRVQPGSDVTQVIERLRESLPRDVRFVSAADFQEQERQYWLRTSPIGFVFTAGLLIGLVVGAVVVYQILYSDVSNHLWEYATMKAMGYRDRQLFLLVVEQSILMSIIGFIPGCLIAKGIFVVTHRATLLPLELSAARLSEVYFLTLLMCCLSGALAMFVLRSADPADIF